MRTYYMKNDNLFDAVCLKIKNEGEYSTITSGVSMYPMLRDKKDIVVVKKADSVKKNDVILYRRKDTANLVLHRVISVTDDSYLTRGDNTYYLESVKKEDIAGVLSAFYRRGKYHDAKKDTGYKIYVFFMRLFYPVRFLFVAIRSKLKK
ncbi:MAG: S24/S26 family peptidase [Clostridia bacterium]|nr:S24/S26 family peptidase [Clostridia bacterium]